VQRVSARKFQFAFFYFYAIRTLFAIKSAFIDYKNITMFMWCYVYCIICCFTAGSG